MTFGLYAKSLAFGFQLTWDDAFYVTENGLIRSLNHNNLQAIFTQTFQGHYSPITIFSYMIDFMWGGLNPKIYHLSNVILHAANVTLCWVLVNRLTGKPLIALLTALVFAIHPLNVEAVAWVGQRKTLLSATLGMSAFLFYLNWFKQRRKVHFVLACILFLFGLGAKSSIVCLPLLFIVYHLQQGDSFKHCVSQALPFLFLSAAFTIVTMLGFEKMVAYETSFELMTGTIIPSSLTIYIKYLQLLVWPTQLCALYDTTLYHSFLAPEVITSTLLLGIITLLFFVYGTTQMRFWFLWAALLFLPSSNIIPLQTFYADRYMYLPMIGIICCLLLGIEKLAKAAKIDDFNRGLKAGVAFITMATLLFFGILTWQRMDVWKTELSLWEDTAAKSPRMFKARLNYAASLERAMRFQEAEEEYTQAILIYPEPAAVRHLEILRQIHLRVEKNR